MTWNWPEVQRLTIVVAIFSVLFLWQHGVDEFFAKHCWIFYWIKA
jgi:preprotein translocase subunit SecE